MKKRLIEWNLPLAEISEESAREKNIRHGHPSTLHIWWARRPLASSRATAFAALIDDPGEGNPEEREYLMDLIRRMTPWEAVKNGNSKDIDKAQELILEQWGRSPKVLDPFAGGGSIPLETLRLGCETFSSDYNPVAAFIEKANLEWPQKFGVEIELPRDKVEDRDSAIQLEFGNRSGFIKINLLLYMVDKWANVILENVRKDIGKFYPPDPDGSLPIGYLWARTITCKNPSCKSEIPLVKTFWLAKKDNKKIAYHPVTDGNNNIIDFEILTSGKSIKEIGFNPSDGTVSRSDALCPVCKQVTKAREVRRLARQGKMKERMLVVVLQHPEHSGKKYRLAAEGDRETFNNAIGYLEEKIDRWPYLEKPIPTEEIPLMSGTFNVPIYGIDSWEKLFNGRQKLAIITFIENVRKFHKEIVEDSKDILAATGIDGIRSDELARAVIGYLGVGLSEILRFSTTINTYKYDAEAVVHMFNRQALPMIWDYFENTPIGAHGGTWIYRIRQMLSVVTNNSAIKQPADVKTANAMNLPFAADEFDAVLTDPPYYNSVPYADLSDFFYVWLKRAIGEFFPDLFTTPTTPKTDEICEMAGWDSKRYPHKDKQFFEEKISQAFAEIYRVMKPGGIAVIVYAHKTTEGWEAMLSGLVNAGLVLTGSWPIHTEMKSRLRAMASATLASSILHGL